MSLKLQRGSKLIRVQFGIGALTSTADPDVQVKTKSLRAQNRANKKSIKLEW